MASPSPQGIEIRQTLGVHDDNNLSSSTRGSTSQTHQHPNALDDLTDQMEEIKVGSTRVTMVPASRELHINQAMHLGVSDESERVANTGGTIQDELVQSSSPVLTTQGNRTNPVHDTPLPSGLPSDNADVVASSVHGADGTERLDPA